MVPPNTNEATQMPHIYKKGRILKFKKLNEGIDRTNRKYLFSSHGSGIQTVVNHCNNLNQVVARNFLQLAKLLSYFGLSKDPSEDYSKDPSVFKRFFKDLPSTSFKKGGDKKDKNEILEKLTSLIEKQGTKLRDLESKIDNFVKNDASKDDIKDLRIDVRRRLDSIDESLKKIIG
ncbi:aphid transmission factor [Soybean Putnam virus]|uniref:Aphid transmission protein n=1 Tax=Soybean Putnam virus TaxID=1221449 RepID=J7H6U5_9VIRU|nr:aphid transmission factor [Soybean Putnam virus]AFP95347.1 aphid transmission factor [Soybean Putnam virus]